jgi:hypothetical protein
VSSIYTNVDIVQTTDKTRLGSVTDIKAIRTLEGVGHWHVIEDAETVGMLLIDFGNSLIEHLGPRG